MDKKPTTLTSQKFISEITCLEIFFLKNRMQTLGIGSFCFKERAALHTVISGKTQSCHGDCDSSLSCHGDRDYIPRRGSHHTPCRDTSLVRRNHEAVTLCSHLGMTGLRRHILWVHQVEKVHKSTQLSLKVSSIHTTPIQWQHQTCSTKVSFYLR